MPFASFSLQPFSIDVGSSPFYIFIFQRGKVGRKLSRRISGISEARSADGWASVASSTHDLRMPVPICNDSTDISSLNFM